MTYVPGPLATPRERPLERHELLALVRDVAGRSELWEHRLDANAPRRTYAALHRDAHVDVWAISWRPENDTGWHDHVSIHAYSPPLWRLGQYAIDDDGALLRVSVSYADELRPIDVAVT